jgi:hypothetical protein
MAQSFAIGHRGTDVYQGSFDSEDMGVDLLADLEGQHSEKEWSEGHDLIFQPGLDSLVRLYLRVL